MADNVAITAGSGTTIAADDIGAGVLVQRVKATWGADGTATDTSATAPFPVTGSGAFSVSATATPAATSHVANDVNGGALTFTGVGLGAGVVRITGASLEIDGATAEATAWRLLLYNVTPPSATADDGAWDLPSGDRSAFLGYVDLGTAVDLGSTQWVEVNGIDKQIKLASANVYGYLINLTTLTPANVAHIITLQTMSL